MVAGSLGMILDENGVLTGFRCGVIILRLRKELIMCLHIKSGPHVAGVDKVVWKVICNEAEGLIIYRLLS